MSDWVSDAELIPIVPSASTATGYGMLSDLNLTSIPLDTFRQVMGIDPWHFWQMKIPTGCSDTYAHYRWICDGTPGRYDFTQALLMAEQLLAQKLDYWPGTRYTKGEVIKLTPPRQSVLYNRMPMKLQTRWMHVKDVGHETLTLVADVLVVYTALDDVVMTIAVPDGTLANEIVVCYDGTTVPIRPIHVTVSANVATITIKKWLMADPSLWETCDVIDPDDTDNLLSSVSVYRVTYNQQLAILLVWEPEIQYCGCLEETCSVCTNAAHLACAVRGDYKNGLIGWQAAEYANSAWLGHQFPSTRYPDLAYVNYLHGANPNPHKYMSLYWAQIVSHFAVSLMDEAACGCASVLNSLRYWMEDIGYVKDSSHTLGPSDIDNPFGTRRGQIAAWKAVLMHVGD